MPRTAAAGFLQQVPEQRDAFRHGRLCRGWARRRKTWPDLQWEDVALNAEPRPALTCILPF